MSSLSSIRRAAVLASAVLLSLSAAAASPRQATGAPLSLPPSFACYEGTFSPFRSATVRLSDELGNRRATVGSAQALCTPASVNGNGRGEPAASLACHSLNERLRVPRLVSIANVFGRAKASLLGSQMLCTAAALTTGGPLSPLPAGLDDFTCYAARAHAAPARPVAVGDSFGRSDDRLGPIATICAPASVDGSQVHQQRLLACYQLTSTTRSRSAILRSRFALLKAAPGVRQRLCVPTSRL